MPPQSFLGLAVFLGIAWLLSENRRGVPWRTVGAGVTLQFALALLLLRRIDRGLETRESS